MTPREIQVIITPPLPAYRQLLRDLQELRIAGAESNTAAVVEAVHEAAARLRPSESRRAA